MLKPLQHCSFCGLSRAERRYMHHGPNVSICGECIAGCVETMAKGERHWRDPIEGQSIDTGLIDITPEKENAS